MILPSADALPEKLLALLAYDASSPLIFSSGLFLFLFAGFMLLYGAFRRAPMARIVYVILFSLYFYYKSSGIYFLLLVFAAASDFAIARAMARTTRRGARRGLVALSVLVNLSMLGYFKYTNFLIDIDVYKRQGIRPGEVVEQNLVARDLLRRPFGQPLHVAQIGQHHRPCLLYTSRCV